MDPNEILRSGRASGQASDSLSSDADSFLLLAAESLIKNAPIGFACLDREFRYRSINPVLAAMNGLSVEAHLGRKVSEVLPKQSEMISSKFEEILATGQPLLNWEVSLTPPSDPDREHYYIASYFPLQDRIGNSIGIGVSVVDITDQKSAEIRQRELREALTAERSITSAVCDQMPAGVAIVEVPSGEIIYRNRAFDKVLGHFENSATVAEYSRYGAFHEDGTSYLGEEYPTARAVLKGETVIAEEMLYRKPDGEVTNLSVSAAPIFDAIGKATHAVSVFYDIREQKVNVERLKLESNLREHFISTLTHDLRGPLSTAKVSTELVIRYPEKTESHLKFLNKAVEALNRCDRMIGDLLDTHRIKAGQKIPITIEECNLSQIARSVVDELAMIHGERFEVEIESDNIIGYWSCDGIRRILENLATNAVKYGSAQKPIGISLRRENSKVVIEVHNFGNEISTEDQKSLFDMFRRSESAKQSGQQGWGIGLTLVKGLSDALGGAIGVKSDPVEGTTFSVSLPFDSRNLNEGSV